VIDKSENALLLVIQCSSSQQHFVNNLFFLVRIGHIWKKLWIFFATEYCLAKMTAHTLLIVIRQPPNAQISSIFYLRKKITYKRSCEKGNISSEVQKGPYKRYLHGLQQILPHPHPGSFTGRPFLQ
jgi:hypothetical protein